MGKLLMKFAKGQRVVARIKKNKWYVGTVVRASASAVSVEFDDKSTAKVGQEDYKDLHLVVTQDQFPRAIDDAAAKVLINQKLPAPVMANKKPVIPATVPVLKVVPKAKLVFVPPPGLQDYATTFKQMRKWLDLVASIYKFAPEQVFKNKKMGSVAVARVFNAPGPTLDKYRRAVQTLQASFAASPLWRAQVFAGANQFFSNNGVFHAAFYDIVDPSSSKPGSRKIGFYITTTVG